MNLDKASVSQSSVKPGDRVRVLLSKNIHAKGTKQKFSREIFSVVSVTQVNARLSNGRKVRIERLLKVKEEDAVTEDPGGVNDPEDFGDAPRSTPEQDFGETGDAVTEATAERTELPRGVNTQDTAVEEAEHESQMDSFMTNLAGPNWKDEDLNSNPRAEARAERRATQEPPKTKKRERDDEPADEQETPTPPKTKKRERDDEPADEQKTPTPQKTKKRERDDEPADEQETPTPPKTKKRERDDEPADEQETPTPPKTKKRERDDEPADEQETPTPQKTKKRERDDEPADEQETPTPPKTKKRERDDEPADEQETPTPPKTKKRERDDEPADEQETPTPPKTKKRERDDEPADEQKTPTPQKTKKRERDDEPADEQETPTPPKTNKRLKLLPPTDPSFERMKGIAQRAFPTLKPDILNDESQLRQFLFAQDRIRLSK